MGNGQSALIRPWDDRRVERRERPARENAAWLYS